MPWSPPLREFYWAVDRHIADAKRNPKYPNNAPACDLSTAIMPTGISPEFPAPPAGAFLKHVAIGRGTQNYTCANSTAAPAAIGAKAALFNASCVASAYPDILGMLPSLAINVPMPDPFSPQLSTLPPSSIELTGHHYFTNATTPIFNLDINPTEQYGVAVAQKLLSSTAPLQPPNNGLQGESPVAWLYLGTLPGTTGGLTQVYRLNTVGGSPPKTCAGMPGAFEVQYAAEYWFWATS
ncbi:MAG: hypothetical protein Q9227_007665 [Pyrenula ochraceoflavens]